MGHILALLTALVKVDTSNFMDTAHVRLLCTTFCTLVDFVHASIKSNYHISSNRGPGLYFVDDIFDSASKWGRPLNVGGLYLPIVTSRTVYSLILAVHARNTSFKM